MYIVFLSGFIPGKYSGNHNTRDVILIHFVAENNEAVYLYSLAARRKEVKTAIPQVSPKVSSKVFSIASARRTLLTRLIHCGIPASIHIREK